MNRVQSKKHPQTYTFREKTFNRLGRKGHLAAFMRNIRFINERLIVLCEIKRKGLAGIR
jgi:hypothetical protein